MKKTLLILFVFISASAFSQFGIKGGVSYVGSTNYTNPDFNLGLSAGIFTKMGSFRPELNYYQHSLKSAGYTYTDNYLNLSSNFEFDLGAVGLLAGVGWDYWLSSTVKYDGNSLTASSSSDDIVWNLNVGISVPMGDALILDLRYQKLIASGLLENLRFDYGVYSTMLTVGYMFGN